MADIRTNAVNAWESTLSSALATGATTINVTDTTGSPAVPFYVVLDPGNDSKREVVLVDGAKTATTFTLSAATSRGQDGTSDVAHDSGAVVAIVPVAAMFNDLHDRADAGDTALTTHEGAADPHPDYLTAAEGDALFLTPAEGNAAYRSKTAEGFRAYRSTAQALAAATFTTIVFDIEVRDDGADYNPATGEWTVPETGWYQVGGAIQFAGVADSERAMTNIFVNGAEHTRLADVESGGAGEFNVGGSVPMYLAAADVVTLRGWRAVAGNVGGVASRTYFTAVKV